MKNILFIHQSAELYGSDKTLLLLLKSIDKTKFNPLVVLPFDGPLKTALEKENITVVIAPVLKLYRKMFSPKNLIKFFLEKNRGIKILDELNKEHKFDLVYSNTLAVLLGLFYAKKRNIKHLWHVHEIIKTPKIFSKLFCKLLAFKSNTYIVYNSIATMSFWNVNSNITNKSSVIWNGIEINNEIINEVEKSNIKKTYFKSKSNDIIIALVGRISRWKGQLIALDSFIKLIPNHNNIKLVFIGSAPPNQDNFLQNLESKIIENKLQDVVTIIPFQENIFKFWQSIDIAIVPSTEPEPFGLVAIEAMMASKPVIGSNHGGLTEIIVNNETGFLFEPNNETELTLAIEKLVKNAALREKFGENGKNRVINSFSLEQYISNFENLFNTILENKN
jgi:glycosyltransferase involved in cell wall biosynthesis